MFELLSLLFGLTLTNEPVLPNLALLTVSPAPELRGAAPAPVVAAAAVVVLDVDSGKILFSQNAQVERPIASLTKMMTAVIARENFGLEDLVTVSKNAAAQPPAKVWLQAGEQLTVRSMLYAALVESGNDAAVALAEHYAGGEKKFVEAMNAKVAALGLQHTQYANPVGWDDDAGYSSAYDVAVLARYLLRDRVLSEMVSTAKLVVENSVGKKRQLVSTNILFNSYLDIRGIKTGSTVAAGECLATLAVTKSGRRVLAVILDSPNRFQEGKALLEWASSNAKW